MAVGCGVGSWQTGREIMDAVGMNEAELYDAVGRVVVEATALEYELSLNVEALLNSESGQVVASGQSFEQLRLMALEIVRYGYPELPEDLVAEVRVMLDRAKVLYDARNQAVHGLWSLSTGERPAWSVRHRRWARESPTKYTSREDLLRLAQDLQDVVVQSRAIGPRIAVARDPGRAYVLRGDQIGYLAKVPRGRHVDST